MADIARMVGWFGAACVTRDTKVVGSFLFACWKAGEKRIVLASLLRVISKKWLTSLAWLIGSVLHASRAFLPCCVFERLQRPILLCKIMANVLISQHRSHGWLVRYCMRSPRYQGCGCFLNACWEDGEMRIVLASLLRLRFEKWLPEVWLC